jgi:hypothetical protein
MLAQLHWQNESNPKETRLVMQGEFNSREEADELLEKFRLKIVERRPECPFGWIPMICDENYEGFKRAAEPVTG